MAEPHSPCDWVTAARKTLISFPVAPSLRIPLDILALAEAGVPLSAALAAAGAVYGPDFNGVLTLKALTYFADGNLPSLSSAVQTKLRKMANEVDFRQIRPMNPKGSLSGEGGVHE